MKHVDYSIYTTRFRPLDIMFSSPLLTEQFKRTASTIANSCIGLRSREEATVFGLLDCYTPMCTMTDFGEDSPECAKVIQQLLSPILRGGLRQFYADIEPNDMNPSARAFRERLSILCQEQL